MGQSHDKRAGRMTETEAGEEAAAFFLDGYNCAQAVLMTLGPPLGLPAETAARLASGFGLGLSSGATCGAVSGAVMALGLAFGGGGPRGIEAKKRTYGLARDFLRRFAARRGTTACRDILGLDPSTPEGGLAARRQGLFETVCAGVVAEAAGEVLALIEEQRRGD